jgi:HEAT repeat protein
MTFTSGTLNGVRRAAVAVALLLPAGAPAADSPTPTAPPEITEVGGKKLKEWIADLKRMDDPSLREEAIRAIVLFPNAKEALPALLDRIHDPDESPRIRAVQALRMIQIDDKDKADVAKKLGERLNGAESQGPIRYDLAVTLGGLGKDAKEALPGLLYGAEDQSSYDIRKVCIAVAAQAGMIDKAPDAKVTRTLVRVLGNDRAAQVRLQCIKSMAQMGKPPDEGLLASEVAAVRAAMKDRDKTVVIWAHLSMMALDKIDKDDIDYLTANTKPPELDRIRVQAIGALGMVGTKEKQVVSTLIDLLADKEPDIVAAACQALGNVGDPGEKAEAALIAVAKDEKLDQNLRFEAIYALAAIGTKGKLAVTAVIELLADKDPNVIVTACYALGLMGEPGGAAEQALTNLSLNMNVSESVRKYAKSILEVLAKPKK